MVIGSLCCCSNHEGHSNNYFQENLWSCCATPCQSVKKKVTFCNHFNRISYSLDTHTHTLYQRIYIWARPLYHENNLFVLNHLVHYVKHRQGVWHLHSTGNQMETCVLLGWMKCSTTKSPIHITTVLDVKLSFQCNWWINAQIILSKLTDVKKFGASYSNRSRWSPCKVQ